VSEREVVVALETESPAKQDLRVLAGCSDR
jgi:hypothetical protein